MRNNYFFTLLLTLCISAFSFGQTTLFSESFETGNSGIASQDCNDGSSDFFTRTDGTDISSNYQVSGQDGDFFFAAMDINGSPCTMNPSTLEFNDIDITGASDLNFAILLAEDDDGTNQDWDSADYFRIEYDIDNSGSYVTLMEVNSNGVTTNGEPFLDGVAITNIFTEFIRAIPATGNEIDIRMTFSLDSGDEDIALDFIRLVDGAIDSPPSLAISGISEGQVFSPETTDVPMTFNVNNFTLSGDAGGGVSDNTGDGYILGTAVENGVTETQNIFNVNESIGDLEAGDSVTLTVELVDNSGNSLTPPVSASVSFTIASYTQVADIAALRAGTEGDYYELTGQAIMTVDAMNSRNQKYIQDTSAAILIDDNDGVITTSYNVGDGITGIKGRLGSFGQVLQFIPEVDPGVATTTGNTVTPQVVTIADLNANLNDYESQLIKINDVNFTTANGTEAFGSGNGNYDITDGTNTLVFRLNWTTDINGTVIPTSSANITGIAAEFNGTSQIFGISLADIVLGVEINEILGYTAYPNPVKGNQLTVTANSLDTKTVAIYNVLGKKVFTRTFSGAQDTFDVSNVASGIYILKVTEGNRISTQKLIIE